MAIQEVAPRRLSPQRPGRCQQQHGLTFRPSYHTLHLHAFLFYLLMALSIFSFGSSRSSFNVHVGYCRSLRLRPWSPFFTTKSTGMLTTLTAGWLTFAEGVPVPLSSGNPSQVGVAAELIREGGDAPHTYRTTSSSIDSSTKPSTTVDATHSSPTQSSATFKPSSLTKPSRQRNPGSCSNVESGSCSLAHPEGTMGAESVHAGSATVPAPTTLAPALGTTSETPSKHGDKGDQTQVQTKTPAVDSSAALTTGPSPGGEGYPQSMSVPTEAMVSVAAVVAVGALVAGVVVLRRRRRQGQWGNDDYMSYQNGKGRMRRTDQHVGLNSFSSTRSGFSEPREREQFWNP
ncbi:hypothetical protein BC939DRAFT_464023 [Gamsiella multidivaricata]|uniref:uncharacterized protein n=1 Tax=Gamsiella multidivaricata TaxID=101098 RepID=UPI00221FFE82|nr:uncharacterized protein BC939DRAFT_464023 [Gamsiella multidivaricata]KAI7818111.1 hypothetical protein BC939DRAFT_464023 [Gamsiella multidivaricata]